MRFSQTSYSQSESQSLLSVSLVLDITSDVITQPIVEQITTSVQAGDTATGKKVISSQIVSLLECIINILRDQLDME